MILYHTIRLTSIDGRRTIAMDIETMETACKGENVFAVIDSLNKQGYLLTAVHQHDYYLTKRID